MASVELNDNDKLLTRYNMIRDFVSAFDTFLNGKVKPLSLYNRIVSAERNLNNEEDRKIITRQIEIVTKFIEENKKAIMNSDHTLFESEIKMTDNIYIDLKKILSKHPKESKEMWTHIHNFFTAFTGEAIVPNSSNLTSTDEDFIDKTILESASIEKNTGAYDMFRTLYSGVKKIAKSNPNGENLNDILMKAMTDGTATDIAKKFTQNQDKTMDMLKDAPSLLRGIATCIEKMPSPAEMAAKVEP